MKLRGSLLGGWGESEETRRQKHRERGSESYVLPEMKEGLTNQGMQAASRPESLKEQILPRGLQMKSSPADTSILDFRPPELSHGKPAV